VSTNPPNKPRRRIAGEAKPGDVVKKSRVPKLPKAPKATAPASSLPKAPSRLDSPSVPKAARARSISLSSWALITLTIAALVFAASGGWQGVRHFSGDDAGTTREDASDAAAVAAETIFSYQYNKLKQHLSDSKELMTPKFGKKFEDISPALSTLAPQRRIQVKAVVRNAATIECGSKCDEDKAKVLVFIDQARVADGVDKPTVFGNRVEMTMVKRNGDWLVDDVKAL
jgi:hypothetical protein